MLVSCLRSSQSKSGNASENLVGRLDPHEWLGLRIVGRQVEPDCVLQGSGAAVATTPDLLFGERCKPTLDLVDPGRIRGRENERGSADGGPTSAGSAESCACRSCRGPDAHPIR